MRTMHVAMTMMTACLMAGLLAAGVATAQSPTYGDAMPEGEATPIAQALADVDAHGGQPRKFVGEVTEVCQKKGCFMILADGERFARVTMHDYAFFVPKDSRGRATVYGTLTQRELSAERAQHYAADAGRPDPMAQATREFAIDALSIRFEEG